MRLTTIDDTPNEQLLVLVVDDRCLPNGFEEYGYSVPPLPVIIWVLLVFSANSAEVQRVSVQPCG